MDHLVVSMTRLIVSILHLFLLSSDVHRILLDRQSMMWPRADSSIGAGLVYRRGFWLNAELGSYERTGRCRDRV